MNPSEPAISQPPAAGAPAAGEAPGGSPRPAGPARGPGGARGGRAGAALALLAALLAGLQASAPDRNRDVWRHLAAGRSLAAGRLPGPDPPLDGPPAAGPARVTWLYDVFLYAGFRLLGGPGLAALGAGLAALLAVLLFLAGRSGADTAWAGACALLASAAL